MRIVNFSRRVAKEILRDPLNIIFGIGFPVVVLLLLSAIQRNIPVPLFELSNLAPGIVVFGLSFISLFSGVLVAKDRESSLFARLCTTPMKSADFIFGYILPMFPIAFLQSVVCFAVSLLLGLDLSMGILYALLFSIPIELFFISVGLFCGSILSDKQVGGFCGAFLTNLTAWLSGIWFDISLVGDGFMKVAKCLPFYHSVELLRAAYACRFDDIWINILWLVAYCVLITSLAVIFFKEKMKKM